MTLPGLASGRVTGIDVLRGQEQQVNSSLQDGGVIIRGLLIRDYPLILKVSNP